MRRWTRRRDLGHGSERGSGLLEPRGRFSPRETVQDVVKLAGPLLGSLPPKPKLDAIVPLDETRGAGYVTRNVRLEFGPDRKATAQVTVTIPDGAGPFPVLIGNGWTGALLRRGYISCSFNDSVDQRSNLPELYPGFDFATMGQRAWTAQLVVDYLFTLPQVDKARIAITGYSRAGKMATIAAALDERIAAVIAGSTGVGGVLPWRLAGERGMGEGIESTTRAFPLWFAPQLRFFSGTSQPKDWLPRAMTHAGTSGASWPGLPRPPLARAVGPGGGPPRPANPAPKPRPPPAGIVSGRSPSSHSTDLRISAAFVSQSLVEVIAPPPAFASRSVEPRWGKRPRSIFSPLFLTH